MDGHRIRLLGLDFGAKTLGVAVSDELGLTAQALETVYRPREDKLRQTLARVKELTEEYSVSKLILGLPLQLDGSEGERCVKTREFGVLLEKRTGLPVEYVDERLTTAQAERVMKEAGIKGSGLKKYSDELSAVLILQTYMDLHRQH